MDVERIEAAEAELDGFISRRHDKRVETEGEREEEALWKESERRHRERRRRENRAAWYGYFCRLADVMRARAAEYDRRAEKLLENDERKESA